jgi:hypothetical protein
MAGPLDTFEAYNSIFHNLSRPVADVFGLKNLGPHFDVLVYSFILFNFANIVLVPGLSRLFFGRIYGALDVKARNKWYVTSLPDPSLGLGNQLSRRASPFSVDPLPMSGFHSGKLTSIRHVTQELSCHIVNPRIGCDPLGHPMPRFPYLVCGSSIRLG